MRHASAAFEGLIAHVRCGMALGAVRSGDPVETAQLICSAVHGAVGPELGGSVLTPDPAARCEALLQLPVDGLRGHPNG